MEIIQLITVLLAYTLAFFGFVFCFVWVIRKAWRKGGEKDEKDLE